MAKLSKTLTSIERDLILNHLPLERKEKGGWRRVFVNINSFGTRVEALRNMADVVEGNMGKLLHGISRKSDALSRLRTASVIANLPKEIAVENERAHTIINSQNPASELASELVGKISTVVPVKSIDRSIVSRLSPDYIANLFKYWNHYKKTNDSTPKENSLFQKVNAAYLERGIEGVKEVKYRSSKAKEIQAHSNIPDSVVRFLEGLDGNVSAKDTNKQLAGKATIFESYKGKLGDYKLHMSEEGDPSKGHDFKSELEKNKKALNDLMEAIEGKIGNAKDLKKLVANEDYSSAFNSIKKAHETAGN